MDNAPISAGPTLEQIQHSLFLDCENELGNERMINFTMGCSDTAATIEAAKRLKDGELELECYVPFTDGWHFAACYFPKTRTGTVLRTWQKKS